jgi:hypothetical protein
VNPAGPGSAASMAGNGPADLQATRVAQFLQARHVLRARGQARFQ